MAPAPHLPTRLFADWGLGLDRPLLIAGPCSAEGREQMLDTALGIRQHAPQVKALRAGIWKPRTRPETFEGLGEPALEWLVEALGGGGTMGKVAVRW